MFFWCCCSWFISILTFISFLLLLTFALACSPSSSTLRYNARLFIWKLFLFMEALTTMNFPLGKTFTAYYRPDYWDPIVIYLKIAFIFLLLLHLLLRNMLFNFTYLTFSWHFSYDWTVLWHYWNCCWETCHLIYMFYFFSDTSLKIDFDIIGIETNFQHESILNMLS